MKRLMMSLFCLSLFFLLAAQTGDENASRLAQTDYQQILDKLQPLAEAGVQNADLYYNLGVCHFHLGDRGEAVLWFLRAQNINSAHQAAKENLVYIHSLAPEAIQTPPRPYLAQLMLRVYDFFSLNRLAVIVLILALLTTLCLHWLLHYPPEKERGLPVLVLSLVALIFLIFAGALLLKHHRFRHNDKSVVMSETAEVYDSPTGAKALLSLPEGSILEVQSSANGMSKVILADGMGGWISSERVERVVPNN